MKMKIKKILTLFVALLIANSVFADISITVVYTDKNGQEITMTEGFTENAPLHVRLLSNPAGLESTASIEWHITNQATGTSITRYEQDTEVDLTESGKTLITVQVRTDNEISEQASLTIVLSESYLKMPNAFSPNGDGVNDIFRAKQDYKSIVEFHAYIFNRHGQKLYDWTNIDEGWDGTYNGHPVKDGVYYVYVKARGADGVEYNIRRDVNLLRNFNDTTTSNGQ